MGTERDTENEIGIGPGDRAIEGERVNRAGPLTEAETDELQDMILTHDDPGAESWLGDAWYEVHPRRDDFGQATQSWLIDHGFTRFVDPSRGPFYLRPR